MPPTTPEQGPPSRLRGHGRPSAVHRGAEVTSVFERIPSLFRFPDNRSSVSRDDVMEASRVETDTVASPLSSAHRTHAAHNALSIVELHAKVKSLEAENEMLRHQVTDTSLITSRRVQQLTEALEAAKMERDAVQIALVREKERCFLLQRRVALLEATSCQSARVAAPRTAVPTDVRVDDVTSPLSKRGADARGSQPHLRPQQEDPYILTSLLPAPCDDHHRVDNEPAWSSRVPSHQSSRICYRLNQSFSAVDACTRMPASTTEVSLDFASRNHSMAQEHIRTPVSSPEPPRRESKTTTRSTLNSVLNATNAVPVPRPRPSRQPPTPPQTSPAAQHRQTSSLDEERTRPRSQRFRSPLFGNPSARSPKSR